MKALNVDFEDMPEFWKGFNIQPDINALNEMIQTIPKKHRGFEGEFEIGDSSLKARQMHGIMNLPVLQEAGLIQLTDSVVTENFIPTTLFRVNGSFIGQHKDGVPNGFILFVSSDRIFEGHVLEEEAYSWGRTIYLEEIYVGYWYGGYL